ncbi:MAG TPA: YceI family protein [Candidatus Aquilonibacter sp.]|nr:YceI family protein [Candidatus Aquilonibacter sp.]
MKRPVPAMAFLIACSASATAATATFRADPPHSSATFTVTHLGIAHVSGVIPMKRATVEVPDGSNIPVSAAAAFDPAGIDTRNSDRDADLRSAHFFDVANDPGMDFKSTKIVASDATHFVMTGELTMHGQTHSVTLDGQFLGRMTDRGGRTHVAYSAKGTLDRTQWGMTYGQIVASNAVDVDIEIEAIEQ